MKNNIKTQLLYTHFEYIRLYKFPKLITFKIFLNVATLK